MKIQHSFRTELLFSEEMDTDHAVRRLSWIANQQEIYGAGIEALTPIKARLLEGTMILASRFDANDR